MATGSGSTSPLWARTPLTRALGISYPIVQGPFGGFASQGLAATVSNAGALGSLGANNREPSAITEAIDQIRALTDKPFAINLWVSMEDEGAFASGPAAFDRSLAALLPHLAALGVERPTYAPYAPIGFDRQVRAVLDARVPVFSFIFGLPPREILDECRARTMVTMGTATTADEARAIEAAGVDIVIASGFEAGGHRGSFLRPAHESLTGTFGLLQQVAAAVRIPIVAAGGIADARGFVAARALGASGVQIGTAFLSCDGSGASRTHVEALLSDPPRQTGLTSGFTGRLARGLRNQLMDDLNEPGVSHLPYPLQRVLVRHVSAAAERAGDPERLPMWAGQSVGVARYTDAARLIRDFVESVPDVLRGLAQIE